MASAKQELLGQYLDHLRGQSDCGDIAPDIQGRQDARKILDTAAQAKTISQADFKKAIGLYAGQQATASERVAVGSKILSFLDKRQIKLA
jgi:hypothetical protein